MERSPIQTGGQVDSQVRFAWRSERSVERPEWLVCSSVSTAGGGRVDPALDLRSRFNRVGHRRLSRYNKSADRCGRQGSNHGLEPIVFAALCRLAIRSIDQPNGTNLIFREQRIRVAASPHSIDRTFSYSVDVTGLHATISRLSLTPLVRLTCEMDIC
jgi:hypothetical protein